MYDDFFVLVLVPSPTININVIIRYFDMVFEWNRINYFSIIIQTTLVMHDRIIIKQCVLNVIIYLRMIPISYFIW